MDQILNSPLPVVSSQPTFPKWPFIALFSFLLGIASVLAYQKYLSVTRLPARQGTLLVAASPSPFASPKLEAKADDPTADWQASGSRENSFMIKHPKLVNCGGETAGGYINCSLLGQAQRPNTEIGDGFLILFKLHRSAENTPLAIIVDQFIDASRNNSEITQPKSSFMVNKFPGFIYSTRGLGEFKHIFLNWPEPEPYPNSYLEIIITVSDPTGQNYQSIIDSMLSTLSFSDL